MSKSKKHQKAKPQFFQMENGTTVSLQEIIESSRYPVYECRIGDNWQEDSLAHIWLARNAPQHIIAGVYLVDLKCLGLKDTFFLAALTDLEYREYKETARRRFPAGYSFKNCKYELANNIVYGAIEYAGKFGFTPHTDFQISRYILGKKLEQTEKVKFGGKNGKPLFVNGPEDNVEEILAKLTQTVGKDNFDYLIGSPPDN